MVGEEAIELSLPSKTCPMCEQAVGTAARYCSNCGVSLGATAKVQQSTQSKWYHNVWFLLFLLFFVLGPFGLPIVWTNPRLPQWAKILLSVAMALYTYLLIETVIRMVGLISRSMEELNAVFSY